MKNLWFVITLMSVFLAGCGTHTYAVRDLSPQIRALTEPTRIEGRYATMNELMADESSVTNDLVDFGGSAEDALHNANDDKARLRQLLERPVAEEPKCRWWQFRCGQ